MLPKKTRIKLETKEKELAKAMFTCLLIYIVFDIVPQLINLATITKALSKTQTAVGFAELQGAGAKHGSHIQFSSKNKSIYLSCNLPGLYRYNSCPGANAFTEPKYVSVTWFQANSDIFSKANTPLEIRDIKTGDTYLHTTPQEFKYGLWKHLAVTILLFGSMLAAIGYFAFFKKRPIDPV